MSLAQLAQFIKVNGHLPEVPSAKDVARNGICLSVLSLKTQLTDLGNTLDQYLKL